MMKPSTFFFLTGRGVRNMGKHWAMTIACVASLSVCMALNIFASLLELNVDSMVSYLGTQNEMVVYLEPEADGELMQKVGDENRRSAGHYPYAVHVQAGRAGSVPYLYGGLCDPSGRV